MELVDKTIGQCFSEAASRYSGLPAFISASETVSWEDAERLSNAIACLLLEQGVRAGNHVGIWSKNSIAMALCFYGVVKMGAVAVLLNSGYREGELVYALEYADVELLLVGDNYYGINHIEICEGHADADKLPKLRKIIKIYELIAEAAKYTGIPAGYKAEVRPQDTATILFTSGTTGKAKGAMLTHYGLINNSIAMAESLLLTVSDRICLALPLFHCFCLSSNLLSCLHNGSAAVIPAGRHSIDTLTAIQKHGCTILNAVPTLLQTIVNRDDFDGYDLSTLRAGILGGAPVAPSEYRRILEKFPMRLLPSLGQTEATAGVTMTDYNAPAEDNASVVGKFLPHIRGEIRSLQNGKSVPVGETGEICVHGYGVMRGYYKPDAACEMIDLDGWLHTGDLGWLDEKDRLHIFGRKKEIIIRGGENISPIEIEEVLASDPRISGVKCVGVPDLHFGEEICACVSVYDGCEITEDDVRTIVRERLVSYKTPHYVVFLKDFPRTVSGKVSLEKIKEYAVLSLGLSNNP